MEKVKNEITDLATHPVDTIERDVVNPVVKETGMEPWMVFAILAVIVLIVVGLIGWCVYRFCRKKRPKKDDKEAGKPEDDEDALVANEEVKDEEEEAAKAEEAKKGRIKYRLEYDFTTQELKVSVLECAELPPTDWSTGLTDPFVKVYLLPDKKPKYETKVHRKNLNPKFDQTFVFKNIPYV